MENTPCSNETSWKALERDYPEEGKASLYALQKWLRDKHDLSIEVTRLNRGWLLELIKISNDEFINGDYVNHFSDFEEALEYGIKQGLKLI